MKQKENVIVCKDGHTRLSAPRFKLGLSYCIYPTSLSFTSEYVLEVLKKHALIFPYAGIISCDTI